MPSGSDAQRGALLVPPTFMCAPASEGIPFGLHGVRDAQSSYCRPFAALGAWVSAWGDWVLYTASVGARWGAALGVTGRTSRPGWRHWAALWVTGRSTLRRWRHWAALGVTGRATRTRFAVQLRMNEPSR